MNINMNTITTKFIQNAELSTLLEMVQANQISYAMADHAKRQDLVDAMTYMMLKDCYD